MVVIAALAVLESEAALLIPRILSALVLAPVALICIWQGGWAFAALVALAAGIMCWEWQMMVAKQFTVMARLSVVIVVAAVLLANVIPLAGVALVVIAAGVSPSPIPNHRIWVVTGAVYVGLPSVVLVWLRADEFLGQATILWLMLLVWATDTGAYAFGRLIGGPKLMPVVSPNKTWAGLVGGALCAGLTGVAFAAFSGHAVVFWLGLASAALAVVAQAGDLFESWAKRIWGVKDSSRIIPGHGGVLDRVDGILSVAVALGILQIILGRPVLGL